MDSDTYSWLAALRDSGRPREAALARLHAMMLRIASHEAYQRGPAVRITGPELDDIALQAADDAMFSLLTKLDSFRGESRFTTWAYRFVVLEVSNKVARHFWRRPSIALEIDEWERLPASLRSDPLTRTIQRELIVAVRRAIEETLTDHQRDVFLAIVVQRIPLEDVIAKTKTNRGAVYKTVFDARRKIRAFLIAHGYIDAGPTHE